MQFIDLKAQYRALKDEIDANIRGVLDSAQFIGGQNTSARRIDMFAVRT